MSRTIRFVDQTLRDGQQSWWGMRMPFAISMALAPDLDSAGYDELDITGSSLFEIQVKHCKEDPWENLRLLSAAMPKTKLRAGTRSNGIVTFNLTPDAVMDLWVQRLAANGIRSLWIYDGLFNVDKIARLAKVAKRAGCEAVPTMLFSSSPYHTDAYYAERAKELAALDVDGIEIEDASGVLTPERTRSLCKVVKKAIGRKRLELHFHNNTGLAPLNYIAGIEQGADTIHTICRPLANGVAHPSTEAMLRNIQCKGWGSRVSLPTVERISSMLKAIAEQEGLPIGQPAEYDLFHYEHQLPGGMTGTLKNQLKDRGIEASLPAILEEIATIRHELGYPVMATPFSQLIGTQAVMNLMTPGERYKFAPDEIITYVLGHYGKPVGPLDENVRDRILSTPRAKDFINWTPPQPSLEELRKDLGGNVSDDELILRLLVPEKDIAAMRAAGPSKRDYQIRGQQSASVALIEKLMSQSAGTYIDFQSEDFSITLERGAA
ncbi:carboxyltransferase [Panacagrimonas sp.]|uniref:carboxyltransferase n=1 Tax=Panacagrimonas sp. TaxID=2480088 RepID=UPI003B52CBCF